MVGYIIALIIAILLIRLVHTEMESFGHNPLPGYVFAGMFLASVWFHPYCLSHIAMLMLVLSYFPLFESYETENPPLYSLLIYLCLGVASLFLPVILWMVPFFIASQIILRSLTVKSGAATIFGLLVPWLWKWTIDLCFDYDITSFAGKDSPSDGIGSWNFCSISVLVLFMIFLFVLWRFRNRPLSSRSKTRVIHRVIILLSLVSFLLILIFPGSFRIFYGIALVNTSILIGSLLLGRTI